MKQKKRKIIEEMIKNIYLIKSAEIDEFLSVIKDYNEAELDEIIKVLSEAKEKQDDLIGQLAKNDPNFIRTLDLFLKNNTKLLIMQSALNKKQ